MTTMRWSLAPLAAALLAATALTTPATAHAAVSRPGDVVAPTLTASPARLREGDTITVTGTACPTPLTVQALAMQILPADFAKGLPPFAPIDASGVGLVQTAGGVTFHVVATVGRTSRFFRVDCSDGSSTMTTVAAMVYPPIGQIWWIHNAYTTFVATAGQLFQFAARSLDCAIGSSATGTLTAPGGSVVTTMQATIDADTVMDFPMQLPTVLPNGTALPNGTYSGTVTCHTAQGVTVSQSEPVLVIGGADLPGVGASIGLAPWAALLVVAGVGLLAVARRRPVLRRSRL
jgi:hypothetical protein